MTRVSPTPLANLKLHLHLLDVRPEKHAKYLETLREQTDRLEQTIKGILFVSDLMQGLSKIEFGPVDLNLLVAQIDTDLVQLNQKHGHELIVSVADDLPLIQGDPALLKHMLLALLTNAINYTPDGGRIHFSVSFEQADDNQWILFRIQDSGPGLSSEDVNRLFERFYRGQAALDSGTSGAGLGLFIAREIAAQHCGQVTASSTDSPGSGAIFDVRLPTG
jgi:signal transduction histidine kinase